MTWKWSYVCKHSPFSSYWRENEQEGYNERTTEHPESWVICFVCPFETIDHTARMGLWCHHGLQRPAENLPFTTFWCQNYCLFKFLTLHLLFSASLLQVFGHPRVIRAWGPEEISLPHSEVVQCALCSGKQPCRSRSLQPFRPVAAPLHHRQPVPVRHAPRGLLQCPHQVRCLLFLCWSGCFGLFYLYLPT